MGAGFGGPIREHPLRTVSSGTVISNGSVPAGEAAVSLHPPTSPPQTQIQPQSYNFHPRNSIPTGPSFHVLANNQVYKVPVDEVVHPSTGMVVNSVIDPSSSPILGATKSTSGTSKGGKGKRPAAGTIIIMKDFETRPRRGSAAQHNASGASSPPKTGSTNAAYQQSMTSSTSTVSQPRNNQPAGLLPFTPTTPVNVEVQPTTFHAYQHQDHYGQATKDVDMARRGSRGGRGMVPPVGRFTS
jgi:hypothetical protein